MGKTKEDKVDTGSKDSRVDMDKDNKVDTVNREDKVDMGSKVGKVGKVGKVDTGNKVGKVDMGSREDKEVKIGEISKETKVDNKVGGVIKAIKAIKAIKGGVTKGISKETNKAIGETKEAKATKEASNRDGVTKVETREINKAGETKGCLLYTSPSPRDKRQSRMPSSA